MQAASSSVAACDMVDRKVTLPNGKTMYGINPENGMIDPPIWERISHPDRWQTYGVLQDMIFFKAASGPWQTYDEWENAQEEQWRKWRSENAHLEEEPDYVETLVEDLQNRLDTAHYVIGILKDEIDTMNDLIKWLTETNMELQEKCDRVDAQRHQLDQDLHFWKDSLQAKIGKLESVVVKLQIHMSEMDNVSMRVRAPGGH